MYQYLLEVLSPDFVFINILHLKNLHEQEQNPV